MNNGMNYHRCSPCCNCMDNVPVVGPTGPTA